MITVYTHNCNDISQEIYDRFIAQIQMQQLACSCGHVGCLIRHGYYERNVKCLSQFIRLRIIRVFCKECGGTHALLLSSLVPYSQVPLGDQQQIIQKSKARQDISPVMERNLLIDESTVRYVIRQFARHWQQRLLAIGADICGELICPCFSNYSRQFMQIRRTPNQLFLLPT